MTPLAHACFSSKGEEAALVLVNAGANVNVTERMTLEWQDPKYSGLAVFTYVTPVFLAAGRGYAKLVQALIDKKAELNLLSEGSYMKWKRGFTIEVKQTPVSNAFAFDHPEVAEILIKAGGKGPKELKKK